MYRGDNNVARPFTNDTHSPHKEYSVKDTKKFLIAGSWPVSAVQRYR